MTGLAAVPTLANVVYAATAGGGVWRTTDFGAHWTPFTDAQSTLVIGAIALAPSNSNVIYAGTGEADFGPSQQRLGRENIFAGRGVLKSTDGGGHWTLLPGNPGQNEFDRRTISKVVIDPTDSNTVYVAIGPVAVNGLAGNAGVWKSTDGGSTWSDTTAAITTTAAFSDLVMDLSNPQVLYAAVGDPFGDAANGLYKTTNGGASWSPLSNFPRGSSTLALGRITLAVAPSDGQILYAAAASSGFATPPGQLLFLDKSIDGGAHWTQLIATPDYMAGVGDYASTLAASPTDSNTVYAGGATLVRSLDGGTTWADVHLGADGSGPVADQHAATFDASGRFLAGTARGVWRLDDPNSASLQWTDLNTDLGTIQFTGIALDPTDPSLAYGGAQDNGTDKFSGTLNWFRVRGQNGGVVRVDPFNPTTVYHSFNYTLTSNAFLERSDDGGQTWAVKTTGIATGEGADFYPPYVLDPARPGRLLLGTDRVYESTDRGDTWHKLSDPGLNGWVGDTPIDSVAASASDANTIYATTDGFVYVTHDHGASWSRTSPVPMPGLDVRLLVFADPRDAQVAYVVAGNFGNATGGGHVWRTPDGGQHWADVSGNLPDLPAWSFALNPGTPARLNDVWYVGTDAGVYDSANGGATWAPLGVRLPNAAVTDLEYQPGLQLLAAGTNGRGMWEIQIPVGSTVVATAADAGAGVGPKVSLFDGRTGLFEYSFDAYESGFTGGVRIAVGDVNGDGTPDVVTAPGPGRQGEIRVWDSRTGALERALTPYDPHWHSGVFVAVADVNDDGFADIVTGADAGGGPHVEVFSGKDGSLLESFFAYDPSFPGGVRVAAADVNHDGFADVITGAGPGGGPHVEVWSGKDGSRLQSFMAYDPAFAGGVYVAGGDVNGDGFADVITGAGAGGGPHVKVFSGQDHALLDSYYAFGAAFDGGVRVAAGDVNGDGRADVVAGAGPGGLPKVRIRDAVTHSDFVDFEAFAVDFTGGVFVGGPS